MSFAQEFEDLQLYTEINMDQVRIAAKGKLGVDAIYIHRNFAVLARISKEYLAWE
jgi:hypothetical protein